tara:strand:+ start:221 stop:628 length:408 start_codon:yes stop_codon:yes gene_type:complete
MLIVAWRALDPKDIIFILGMIEAGVSLAPITLVICIPGDMFLANVTEPRTISACVLSVRAFLATLGAAVFFAYKTRARYCIIIFLAATAFVVIMLHSLHNPGKMIYFIICTIQGVLADVLNPFFNLRNWLCDILG